MRGDYSLLRTLVIRLLYGRQKMKHAKYRPTLRSRFLSSGMVVSGFEALHAPPSSSTMGEEKISFRHQ